MTSELTDRAWQDRPDGYFINRMAISGQYLYWVFTADFKRLNEKPLRSEDAAEKVVEQHKRGRGKPTKALTDRES